MIMPIYEVNGHLLETYSADQDAHVSSTLMRGECYENLFTQTFKQWIDPGSVVIDVGANIGYYTLLAAKLVGPYGTVLAFEPDDANFDMLQRNLKHNYASNVVAFKGIVSDSSQPSVLYRSVIGPSCHRQWLFPDENAPGQTASAYVLDELVLGKHVPSVIKMDVEGAEWRVLQGMSRLLRSVQQVVLFAEFWPEGITGSGGDPLAFLMDLTNHGFVLGLIDEGRERIFRTTPAQLMNMSNRYSDFLVNLVCLKGCQ